MKKHLGVHKEEFEEYSLNQAEKDKENVKQKGEKRSSGEKDERPLKQSKLCWDKPNMMRSKNSLMMHW